jgi:hypothetical protein
VLGSAMLREGSWSRSNFSWGTFRCRPPNATWAASSEFDPPSMIGLASSRTLDVAAQVVEGLLTFQKLWSCTLKIVGFRSRLRA